MTQVSRTSFKSTTTSLYADNIIGSIGADDLRVQMDNIADSVPFITTGNAAAPTVNDDAADTSGNGTFRVGDVWIDETANTAYICLDSTATAAVWQSFGDELAILELSDGSAAAPSLTNSGDTNTGLYFPAADTIAITTAGSEQIRIDSSGNVGIGTTTLDHTLRVAGDVRIGNMHIKESEYTAGTGKAIWADSAGSGVLGLNSSTAIQFNTNNTESVRIDNSGRVGIGTTSPSTLMHLSDDNPYITLQGTNGTGSSHAIQTSGTNSEALFIRNESTGDSLYLQSDNLIFRNASASEAMRVNSSGNVGIGTTTPASQLHTYGDTNANVTLEAQNANAGNSAVARFKATTSSGNVFFGATSPAYAAITGAADAALINTGSLSGGLVIAHEGVGRAWFTQAGALNIGTPTSISGFGLNVENGFGRFAGDANQGFELGYSSGGGVAFMQGYNRGTSAFIDTAFSGSTLRFNTGAGASEAMRINASGNVGIGTTSPDQALTLGSAGRIRVYRSDNTRYGDLYTDNTAFTMASSYDPIVINSQGSTRFQINGTEIARINSSQYFLLGQTTANYNTPGVRLQYNGEVVSTRSNGNIMSINRLGSDGGVANFAHDGNTEGSISISGTTVSYNGAHLSRWFQTPGVDHTTIEDRPEILRGSVLTNLDEMCEWTDENNEQLNKMEVSSIRGDCNVAGVFQAWDDDDDTYLNDGYCAMTGDFVIRIAADCTVQRGDLLMSAGDGTACPQDGELADVVRSCTVAKVTSTTVSHTYEDGSYLVPCVLMAC